jgi:glycine hydroxymethyltransferase
VKVIISEEETGWWRCTVMSKIESLIEKHEARRSTGINLIASENYHSNRVKSALASDLAGRYHSYWYGGTEHAQEIIKETESLAKKLFRSKYAIVTSLSGNMCDLAALFAFSKPGDKVAMMTLDAGGYPFGVSKFHRELLQLPADPYTYQLKLEEATRLILDSNVKLTILGPSFVAFPHPIKELAEKLVGSSTFVFDGSHLLGLIGCGEFQDPLGEGAEVLMGSTHKSLFGPQGGLVLTNSKHHYEELDKMLGFDVDEGIALVDNPHMNRIAALGVALSEIADDPGYAKRVVANAKALAAALDDQGVHVKFKEKGYTQSHQIFLDMDMEDATSLCRNLESVGVFIDIAGRMGTAEVTHVGMDSTHMKFIAEIISQVNRKNTGEDLRKKVKLFASNFYE